MWEFTGKFFQLFVCLAFFLINIGGKYSSGKSFRPPSSSVVLARRARCVHWWRAASGAHLPASAACQLCAWCNLTVREDPILNILLLYVTGLFSVIIMK